MTNGGNMTKTSSLAAQSYFPSVVCNSEQEHKLLAQLSLFYILLFKCTF